MTRTLTRHVVGRAADLPPGARKLVKAGGREIGVFNVHGAYYALANVCPHGGGSLCEGFVTGLSTAPRPGQYELIREGEFLRCPLHGWEFEIATGQSYCDPRNTRLRTFHAAVEQGAELVKGPYVAESFEVRVEEDYVVLEI
jgi:3-phenylpropionate/trans-cinnamate dioxygenase ferredoxin subunit